MNIDEKLKELSAQNELDVKIITDKKEKLKKKYNEDVEELNKELEESNDSVNDYGYLIHSYSTFDLGDISFVLSDLFSKFRGVKYKSIVLGDTYYIIDERVNELFKRLNINISIMNNVNIENKEELCIVLGGNVDHKKGLFRFYFCSLNVMKFFWQLDYLNDEYSILIKNFIDYVIGYRYENKKEEITREELFRVEKMYLKSRLNELKEFYKSFDLKEQQELNDRHANRRLMLDNISKVTNY